MKDKLEEQIKHIKEEHSTIGIGYHLDLLSTLIQQEREEAVKNTILSIMSKVPTIMPHDKPDYILRSDFDRAIKEVESEGKK